MHKNCFNKTDRWNVTTTRIILTNIQYRYNIITSTVNKVHMSFLQYVHGQSMVDF